MGGAWYSPISLYSLDLSAGWVCSLLGAPDVSTIDGAVVSFKVNSERLSDLVQNRSEYSHFQLSFLHSQILLYFYFPLSNKQLLNLPWPRSSLNAWMDLLDTSKLRYFDLFHFETLKLCIVYISILIIAYYRASRRLYTAIQFHNHCDSKEHFSV